MPHQLYDTDVGRYLIKHTVYTFGMERLDRTLRQDPEVVTYTITKLISNLQVWPGMGLVVAIRCDV